MRAFQVAGALALILIATEGAAQTMWQTKLSRAGDTLIATGSLTFRGTEVVVLPRMGIKWTIICDGTVACNEVQVKIKTSKKTLDLPRPPEYALTATQHDEFLVITDSASKLLLIVPSLSGPPDTLEMPVVWAGEAAPQETTLWGGKACRNMVEARPMPGRESEWIPTFVVDALGNVLVRPRWPIDDRDLVQVQVLAPPTTLAQLRVARRSAFRSVGTINLVGGDINASGLIRYGWTEAQPLGCRLFELTDFAGGKAVVEISAVDEKATARTLGSFEFAVNPTFTGALSFGAIRTELLDPTIGLAFNGTDSVITAKTDGVEGVDEKAHRILYGVFYTYYVWGRRDLDKPRPLHERVNPMMGVILNDVPNNFVGGATLDLADGVFVSIGAHAGKVRVLDPRSGFEFGDVFSGKAEDIPVVRRWRTKFFVGVAIDLRAASQLFKSSLGSGGS